MLISRLIRIIHMKYFISFFTRDRGIWNKNWAKGADLDGVEVVGLIGNFGLNAVLVLTFPLSLSLDYVYSFNFIREKY